MEASGTFKGKLMLMPRMPNFKSGKNVKISFVFLRIYDFVWTIDYNLRHEKKCILLWIYEEFFKQI